MTQGIRSGVRQEGRFLLFTAFNISNKIICDKVHGTNVSAWMKGLNIHLLYHQYMISGGICVSYFDWQNELLVLHIFGIFGTRPDRQCFITSL